MKKFNKISFSAIGIIIAIIMSMTTPAFAASKDVSKQITAYFMSGGKSISVYINGTKITPRDGNGNEVYPFAVSGTTYLPVKAVADALGKVVTWDDTTASVKIDDSTTATTAQNNTNAKPNTDTSKQLTAYYTSGGKTISIYVNGTKITPKDGNGKEVAPFIIDGTTYLPVKAVANALGKEVAWDGATASVKIDDAKAPWSSKDSKAKLTTTVDSNGEYHDSLEYTFTPDKDTVGEWVYYDLIDKKDLDKGFDPNIIHSGPQGWNGISFYEDGTLIEHHIDGVSDIDYTGYVFYNWTKGYIMDTMGRGGDKVFPAYTITKADGKTYMMVEWKSGYYTRTGKLECYYVFVKTSDTPVHSVNKPAEKATPISNPQGSNAKLTTTTDANGGKHDSLDYTFTLDKDAVGHWEIVELVGTIEQFDPTALTRRKISPPHTYDFYEDGKMIESYMINTGARVSEKQDWTKGYVVVTEDIVSAYEIKQFNGKTYMFYEWKNGDYTRIGENPLYYVLEKTSDTPAPTPDKKSSASDTQDNSNKITVTKDSNGVIRESMDYKFVPDKDVVGEWKTIGWYLTISDFNPSHGYDGKLWWLGNSFYDDGIMHSHHINGSKDESDSRYTKGYVFDFLGPDIILSYEIKQIDGKTYMFMEWKSEDYISRGQKPSYYVFEKTSDTPAQTTTK